MSAIAAGLGSTRMTLAVFAMLAAALLLDGRHGAGAWPVALASCAIALNLACAIATHRRLRTGALGVFHLGLLALIGVAAFGQLTRFEGHVEIVEGGRFDPGAVAVRRAGPLHAWRLKPDAFVQGPISIDYAPGVKRSHTRSSVAVVRDDGALHPEVVGDDVALRIDGYRLYTTHNKGFAPIVSWLPDRGGAVTGALHLPSYPLFDWRQETRWELPGAGEVRVFLQLDATLAEDAAWTLAPGVTPAALVVHDGARRVVLRAVEEMRVPGGRLRFERLVGWMGYRIFYDPTLPWLLGLALVSTAGLAVHVFRRAGSGLPLRGTDALPRGVRA